MRVTLTKEDSLIKNSIVTIKEDQYDGFFYFGDDNKLPLEIIDAVNNSGTARSCTDKLGKFIFANGLVEKTLSTVKANAKQTFDSFIASLTPNVCYFEAVCFRVLINNAGVPAENPAKLYNLPVNELRRSKNSFVWNKKFGASDYDKRENIWLDEFDPEESPGSRRLKIQKQINTYGVQYGFVVFVFEPKMGENGDIYPIPNYYSGIEDIESDASLQKLERRNIIKGFRTPIIVSTGPIDNDIKDENGKTALKRFDELLQRFTGPEAASMMHIQAAQEELKPKITTIDIAEVLNQTEGARDRVGRAVCRHFNVAPVLVGFATAGQLGNVQELENTIELMQLTVIGYQMMITNALSIVFPGKNWTLSTLNIFRYIPDFVLQKLPDEELERLYEVKIKPKELTANPPAV